MKQLLYALAILAFVSISTILLNKARNAVSEHKKFNDTWQSEIDARRAKFEKDKTIWEQRRIQDSIETARYCKRVDSMIVDLKEVTRQFNVLSRWPDNVTQKEYDEIMK